MDAAIQYVSEKWAAALGGSWRWFAALNREEWVVVLAVACAAGFFCMRGYGSRSNF
ncbi:MAG: hypothetical protein AAF790_03470 [Planctomycetota bacterium]